MSDYLSLIVYGFAVFAVDLYFGKKKKVNKLLEVGLMVLLSGMLMFPFNYFWGIPMIGFSYGVIPVAHEAVGGVDSLLIAFVGLILILVERIYTYFNRKKML